MIHEILVARMGDAMILVGIFFLLGKKTILSLIGQIISFKFDHFYEIVLSFKIRTNVVRSDSFYRLGMCMFAVEYR